MKIIVLGFVASLAPALASIHSGALRVDDQDAAFVQKARYVRGLTARREHRDFQPISINSTDPDDIAQSAWSRAQHVEKAPEEKPKKKDDYWTSSKPDSTDFNPETMVDGWPFSIESTCAFLLILAIASAPVVLAAVADQKLTRTHMLESCALIAWLGGVLYLFTSVLKFQSVHWDGFRPLTIVESVYLLAQILTTVGYGDITPAFPRGQVWVGFNVIIGLCLYGSIVMEVVGIVYARIEKVLVERRKAQLEEEDRISRRPQESKPLKDWAGMIAIDYRPMIDAAVFFGVMASIGITFFHYKAGEDRTWLQATYMSVITLSTVGFGAFTPITEAGKVFGALWMLVGVSALAAVITSFVDLMMRMKTVQHMSMQEETVKFEKLLDTCCSHESGKAMDAYDFLKFAMMLKAGTKIEDLKRIEDRFRALGPNAEGNVSLDRIDQAERPSLS